MSLRRSFALVIGLLFALAPTQVAADLSSPIMTVFSGSGSSTPQFSLYFDGAWTAPEPALSVGANPYWIRTANCPLRNEIACVTLDAVEDVNLSLFDGSSWISVTELTANSGDVANRCFDVCYEQLSGDMLMAYYNADNKDIRYVTYDGNTLSAQAALAIALPSGGRVNYVTLYPKRNSNQVLMLVLTNNRQLTAIDWNGSAWGAWFTLDSNMASINDEPYSLAYESISGTALAVYGTGANEPYFRTWNGTMWSASGPMPAIGKSAYWIRLAADPASDEIIFAALDRDNDINVNVWNGSAWGGNLEVETEATYDDRRQFDIAYENGGNEALLVYHETGQNKLRYRVWTGSAWSTERNGKVIGENARTIRLEPGAELGEVFVLASDDGGDLQVMRWNGGGMVGTTQLSGALGGAPGVEQFALVMPVGVMPPLADVSVMTNIDVFTSNDQTKGSGLHWADFDNDGDLDVIATGNSASRLLMNNNAGESFTATVFGGGDKSRQGALIDIDNDNDIDFWVRDEMLFENDGAAAFANQGDLGFGDPSINEGLAAGDVNRDGWCDIVMFSSNGNWIGHHQAGLPSLLTGTNGVGYGLNDTGDAGNGTYISSADVNNDGYIDFFYHYNGGKLFLSNGDGTYTENASGISVANGNSDRIGTAWADYDNDGDLDLYVPRFLRGQPGYLYRNDGGTFTNVATAAGINSALGQRSVAWGDYDNDGDQDLYLVNHGDQPNILYRNNGNGTFSELANVARARGDTHDAVWVDYNNDGNIDLAMSRQAAKLLLLRNTATDKQYLKVRILGRGGGATNRAAIGVRVDIYDETGTVFLQRRDVGVARGFGGTEPLWLHFGGLNRNKRYTVKVYFHSRPNDEPLAVSVIPRFVSTTIGLRTIPQMLTIEERAMRIKKWREIRNKRRWGEVKSKK